MPARALTYGRRPDPAAGVFETVLIENGDPVLLDEHLARLRQSLTVLYGVACDHAALASAARAAGAGGVDGRRRLRILADPDGRVWCETQPERAVRVGPVMLSPFLLPGGLGAHKWRDRSLLDALMSAARGAVPLIVDTDGCVLEAAWANIWIREGDALLTPPADGRLLPGVTRAALLASEPSANEERLDLARMVSADAVFITSSISGRRAASLTEADFAAPH